MAPVYYQVVGGEPLDFCRDFRSRRTAVREVNFAWAESKGATGVMEAWGKVWGLIFPRGDVPAGWKQERKRAGDGSMVHTPNKKSEAGKALAVEIAGLSFEPKPQEFADRFGIPSSFTYRKSEKNWGCSSLTGIFPYTSFIAWTDSGDSFWVVLPDIDKEIGEMIAEGWACDPAGWTVPDGIVRSTRARYDLAVAQAAVADEQVPA